MFTKAICLTAMLVAFGGGLSSAHATTQPDQPEIANACHAYADLLSTPVVAQWYREHMPTAMPEELRTAPSEQWHATLLTMLGNESEEQCSRGLSNQLRRLQDQVETYPAMIDGLLPQPCHAYRATYEEAVETRFLGDQNKLPQTLAQRDARLLHLKAADPQSLAEYCTFGAALWNHADEITAHDFDEAKQKFPLPDICDAAYDELKSAAFATKTDSFSGAWAKAGMKRALPFLLDNRAYMALRYGKHADELLQTCKKRLDL
ncbi:MAG: hypothetical protein QM639_03085 [Rhodocyclaceae bacterium]